MFGDTTKGTCDTCSPSCLNCTAGTSSDCKSCKISTTNPLYLNPDFTCQLQCPGGYFKDPTIHKCMPCDGTCSTCGGSQENDCLTCAGNRYFV